MNAVFTLGYDIRDLFKSKLASVTGFESTPWPETNIMDSKNDGVKKWRVGFVEGTVDKDISCKVCRSFDHLKVASECPTLKSRERRNQRIYVFKLAVETNRLVAGSMLEREILQHCMRQPHHPAMYFHVRLNL